MTPAIELHLRIQIKDKGRDRFLAFLKEAIPFYESPGGIRVRLLEDPAQSGGAVEVLEYATQADYDRDQERAANDPEMKTFLKRWRALLSTPPVVEVYRRVTP
jgi:hypothetical protein